MPADTAEAAPFAMANAAEANSVRYGGRGGGLLRSPWRPHKNRPGSASLPGRSAVPLPRYERVHASAVGLTMISLIKASSGSLTANAIALAMLSGEMPMPLI